MVGFLPSGARLVTTSQATGFSRRTTANSSPYKSTAFGILGAAFALLCIALVPLMTVEIPPLVDYPNHLARMHILADGGHSPWLRQYYDIHWDLLPNLSMDLVVPPLTRIMSVEQAGKMFIALTFALLAGGTMALHAALHRRWSPWPLLAFFFLYNSVFLWGFLNYLFGLGLALFACALWVRLRTRSALLVVPLFSLIAVMLFFAHLFAFGSFALIVSTYELSQWWRLRDEAIHPTNAACWKAAPALIIPLIILTLTPTFKVAPEDYPLWLRGSSPPPLISFLSPVTKLEALKGTIRTEHRLLDRVTVLMLVGLVGIGLVRRRCSILPSMFLPLGATALAAMAMPNTIGTTAVVDIRMPIVFVLLTVASSDWREISRAWFLPVALALSTVFAVRMGYITEHWQNTAHHYRQFKQILDQLPEGARLLSAIKMASYDNWSPAEGQIPEPMPMVNLSCWGVIRRSVFVSNLFAAPGQQPVRLTPAVHALLTVEEFLFRAAPIPWDQLRAQYDYVVVRRTQRLRPPPPPDFVPFGSGDEFQFYRTGRGQP